MIIPLYKKYGTSTHQLAHKAGKLYGEKATHTGTLDPAAEGVVVVLTGGDRFTKQQVADSKKAYRAEVLFGISTDTHDLVGYPTGLTSDLINLSTNELEAEVSHMVGKIVQTQPRFSAQRIKGSSAFDLAKQGKAIEATRNEVTIHSIKVLSLTKVDITEVRERLSSSLKLIEGDFRQAEILTKWNISLEELSKQKVFKLPLATIEIVCSKRTYIRALVRDISESLGVPATLHSLVRTQNGPYSIADCLCLV